MYHPLDRSKPCPFPIAPTQTYLGEDETGYYVMDGFFDNVGNMFKRMFKFTKKSTRPAVIWQGVRNTLLTTMTFGAYQFAPKTVKKKMENVSDYVLPTLAAVGVGVAIGPAVMGAVGPKLMQAATMVGQNIGTIGKGLFEILGALSPKQQAQVAEQVTPQDIAYAEQHQGQFPQPFMNYVDEVARSNYAVPVNTQLYGASSLYPGLQQSMMEPQQETQAAGQWSSGEVMGAVGAAALIAFMVTKK